MLLQKCVSLTQNAQNPRVTPEKWPLSKSTQSTTKRGPDSLSTSLCRSRLAPFVPGTSRCTFSNFQRLRGEQRLLIYWLELTAATSGSGTNAVKKFAKVRSGKPSQQKRQISPTVSKYNKHCAQYCLSTIVMRLPELPGPLMEQNGARGTLSLGVRCKIQTFSRGQGSRQKIGSLSDPVKIGAVLQIRPGNNRQRQGRDW